MGGVSSNLRIDNDVIIIRIRRLYLFHPYTTFGVNSFMDGEDGYYLQQYHILADGKETGVTMTATGSRKIKEIRSFACEEGSFAEVGDAFRAAGHAWMRA